MLIINPKRTNETIDIKPHWYNYYAGYSHTFTKNLISSSNLPKGAIILDPWNGAGTTTLIASEQKYKSIGIDLNPVMGIVSKAKQATSSDVPKLRETLSKIRLPSRKSVPKDDPLNVWFYPESVFFIRTIEKAIVRGKRYIDTNQKVQNLDRDQCLLYTALFNSIRHLLKDFIPSNPTWIKKPKSTNDRVNLPWTELKKSFKETSMEMIKGVEEVRNDWAPDICKIITGSSENIQLKKNSIDLVVTSPPYCTRIDYGVATLPELALICENGESEAKSIRKSLMGTTTVPKTLSSKGHNLGETCETFLESVKNHGSKASETYYLKNYLQYFISLSRSIKEIARVLKRDAKFVCVVQDSHYKDIHCDLPRIIIEIAEANSLALLERVEFESKRNMANLNAKTKFYRSKASAFENVLIFKKGD